MPSNNTKSKRPVVRRTSPTSCSVSRWPVVWKFIASCVDYYADMIEIIVKSEGREMTADESWAHGLARGNAKSLLDETQKPNPTGLRCAGLGAHKQDPVVGQPELNNKANRPESEE